MTEIKHAQRELERANATKTTFLAIIAHDLRGGIFVCALEEVMTPMRVPSRKTGGAWLKKHTDVSFFTKIYNKDFFKEERRQAEKKLRQGY